MDINFTCVNSELSNIINHRRNYDYYIVLLCLVVKEYVMKMKTDGIITKDFIKYLLCVDDYLNCDIDFRYLATLCEDGVVVNIIDNSDLYSLSLSSSLSSSDDLDTKITKILKQDLSNINKIYELYNVHNDKHTLAKCIFEMVDKDDDGYISALDILIMLHDNINEPFVDEDFKYSIINLLSTNQCNAINFDIFMNIFF